MTKNYFFACQKGSVAIWLLLSIAFIILPLTQLLVMMTAIVDRHEVSKSLEAAALAGATNSKEDFDTGQKIFDKNAADTEALSIFNRNVSALQPRVRIDEWLTPTVLAEGDADMEYRCRVKYKISILNILPFVPSELSCKDSVSVKIR